MKQEVSSPEQYFKLVFPEQEPGMILGEKSVSYVESSRALERIANVFPNAKILIIFRDPVERALSNFFFTKEFGLETRTPEEVFIEKVSEPSIPENISVNPFDYLKRGMYAKELKRVLKVIPEKNIKVIFLEEFKNQPGIGFEVLRFLGSKSTPVAIPSKTNPSAREAVKPEVIDELRKIYSPANRDLESLLNRSLTWEY